LHTLKNSATIVTESYMFNLEKYLSFIISLLLPGLNMLSNNQFYNNIKWYTVAPKWLVISLFLVGLWKLIEKLLAILNKTTRWIFIILGSLTYVMLILFVEHYILPSVFQSNEIVPIWVIGIRLLLAAILFITIIQSLKTAKEREKFRVENISLQSENIKAQLNQLKQQVNPHFLFNCLSTLRTMVRSNDKQSEDYVLKLSDMYRHILQKRESSIVTLNEELEFLNVYIYLMKIRHEKALFFDIKVSDESMKYSLPVFSLQLLVENCIKHNVASEKKPLHIRIFQNNSQNIIVSNNYQPKITTADSFGLGIENLKTRYELLGLKYGVLVVQNETEYTITLELF